MEIKELCRRNFGLKTSFFSFFFNFCPVFFISGLWSGN